MQTVWGDLLFFVNFCMDFQCLFLTAKLLRRPFGVWRGALASAMGALYAVTALFWECSGLVALVADLLVGVLMCMVSFLDRDLKIRRIFVPFGVYFGVSFAVGGAMSAMASLLSHVDLPLAEEREAGSSLFFLLAAAGGAATLLWGRFCQRRAKGKRAILRVLFGENEMRLFCMVDTANLLRDPVSGKCVAVAQERHRRQILPPALEAAARRDIAAALTALPVELARRVRLIPAATVTGEGILTAFVPDCAFVDAGNGEIPVEILLAFAPLKGNTDGCEALLPADLLG